LWPYGYTEKEDGAAMTLLDPSGRFVAREGDGIILTGGVGNDPDTFNTCQWEPLQVVTPGSS
jgi:hypothetical protein